MVEVERVLYDIAGATTLLRVVWSIKNWIWADVRMEIEGRQTDDLLLYLRSLYNPPGTTYPLEEPA